VSFSLNNNIRAKDEVVCLDTINGVIVVEDSKLPDLVGWWVVSEDFIVIKLLGVTMSLSSFMLTFLIVLFLWVDCFSGELNVVDMSSQTSLKSSEVTTIRSFNTERSTSRSTEFTRVLISGSETNKVKNITVSTIDFGNVFIILNLNLTYLALAFPVRADVLSTLNSLSSLQVQVVNLESIDEFVVIVDIDLFDFVLSSMLLKEINIRDYLSVTMSLASKMSDFKVARSNSKISPN